MSSSTMRARCSPNAWRGRTGSKRRFALLVVAPFLLVARLLPLLRATRGSRVIGVTSGGMYTQQLDLDDLQSSRLPFSGPRAYARAKRAQVQVMREWAERISTDDISFSTMHPGWADTPGLAAALPSFYQLMRPLLRTPREGADTIIWLATASTAEIEGGRLYLDRRARPFDRTPATRTTRADRRRLWDDVVRMAGIADPTPRRQPVPRG